MGHPPIVLSRLRNYYRRRLNDWFLGRFSFLTLRGATDKRRTLLLGFAAVMCGTFRRRLLIAFLNFQDYSARVRTLVSHPFGAA
jgi:hypothetical protein